MNDTPAGRIIHDYGPGSCFSCGGSAHHVLTPDDEFDTCTHCGRLEYVVFDRDDGAPLQGYMAVRDVNALPTLRDDETQELPF